MFLNSSVKWHEMKAWEYFLARLAATAVTQNIKRAEDHNDHHTRAIVELICKTVLDSTRHDQVRGLAQPLGAGKDSAEGVAVLGFGFAETSPLARFQCGVCCCPGVL
ncbi:hypothetical protein, partial [Methylacidiphilum caldifontis]|uniref:hypothetical protein n=1 Tax=Methylacidiphilum caldifontis TaxID=2795386 RepID=UPI001ABD02DE